MQLQPEEFPASPNRAEQLVATLVRCQTRSKLSHIIHPLLDVAVGALAEEVDMAAALLVPGPNNAPRQPSSGGRYM